MKAAVRYKYGPPEIIQIIDVLKLVPKSSEILVKVHASSVNRTDTGFLHAKPAVVRLFAGIRKPKRPILGCEFAGEIEEIGANVTIYKVGDRVFGFNDAKFGGHGEFAVFSEKDPIATMPKKSDYKTMAAATEGSHYALSYIRVIHKLNIKRVLVHGATGAIGSSAIQLLKQDGVYVVATSNTKNHKLIESLGPDKVIDWEKEDFTKFPEKFDAVFDSVGKSSFRACKSLLNRKGVYISTELGYMCQNPVLGIVSPVFKIFKAKRVLFPVPKNNKEIIEFLAKRVEDGSFKPVIDKIYPLEQIVEAYKYVESGHKTGNVVIKIS